jgi:hypothetical protein
VPAAAQHGSTVHAQQQQQQQQRSKLPWMIQDPGRFCSVITKSVDAHSSHAFRC